MPHVRREDSGLPYGFYDLLKLPHQSYDIFTVLHSMVNRIALKELDFNNCGRQPTENGQCETQKPRRGVTFVAKKAMRFSQPHRGDIISIGLGKS